MLKQIAVRKERSKTIPEFSSWEEEDEFWSAHSVTDLDLEEDQSPLVIESSSLHTLTIMKVPATRKPSRKKAAVSKS